MWGAATTVSRPEHDKYQCTLAHNRSALTGKKDHIYHAAMLDPHTASELPIDGIVALCDDLIEAHGDWLPRFK